MFIKGGAKILVIDDEYVLRQSIVAYLEDSGFTVFDCDNGTKGLEIFYKDKNTTFYCLLSIRYN